MTLLSVQNANLYNLSHKLFCLNEQFCWKQISEEKNKLCSWEWCMKRKHRAFKPPKNDFENNFILTTMMMWPWIHFFLLFFFLRFGSIFCLEMSPLRRNSDQNKWQENDRIEIIKLNNEQHLLDSSHSVFDSKILF